MEQILNKLSEIEITAQRIMEDAGRSKAALSAEMEQQCRNFDAELEQENKLLKAQLNAATERSDFIEDCIAEMAMQVYAE